MLSVHQLAKSFALTTLFEDVTFHVNDGDRVGLVGPNGCGKTTLLRIIAGEARADSGSVALAPGARPGYLAQGFELPAGETIASVVGRAAGDPEVLAAELVALSERLSHRPDDEDLHARYDDVLAHISQADTGRAAAILAGLGLDQVAPETLVGNLSGGQKTRLQLALVLLDGPRLLLLDEPTNHLDIEMLEWLEDWLRDFDGGVLLVSHDRTFLDRTVNRILAFNGLAKTPREFAGNYSEYEETIAHEREKQWAAYQDQQKEVRRLKQDIERAKAQAAKTEWQASSVRRGGELMKLKGYKDYQQGIAKKVAKKAKARERKLDRYLDDDDRVTRPRQRWEMRLDFENTIPLGQFVLRLEDLAVGYRPEAPLLTGLRLDVTAGARIALTGPNGSGKTTLLRTIAGQLAPLAGQVDQGPSVRLGYMTQEQTNIDPALTPLQTIRPGFKTETDARGFLAYFLFTGAEPLLPNHTLSFGQRARLSLAQLVAAGCNVLLLDEPVNHLDIGSRTQFEEALSSFDGTILAVIHDRYFIERYADELWWVEDGVIRRDWS